jgi:hypothetical protein
VKIPEIIVNGLYSIAEGLASIFGLFPKPPKKQRKLRISVEEALEQDAEKLRQNAKRIGL